MFEKRGDRIARVPDDCHAYWKTTGIRRERAEEMAGELGLHLREALEDGKGVEDVLGPDVEAFAEEWAAPNRQARSLLAETLDVVSDALIGLVVLAALAHLALRSASLPVSLGSALSAAILALILARLFAHLRPPADAPPESDEGLLDRYPKRLYATYMCVLIAAFAVQAFLPLPEGVLFEWPLSATLALPVITVLARAAKRFIPGRAGGGGGPPRETRTATISAADGREEEIMNVLFKCEFQWMKLRLPQDEMREMLKTLKQHLEESTRDGKPLQAVVGPDVTAFAEAWAADSGVEPDLSPEPLRHVIQGWVLSVSGFAAGSATFIHVLEWTLYVPVAWILGTYLFVLSLWFFGEHVARLIETVKRWQRSPLKSMLAAGAVVGGVAAVSVIGALFFMVAGPAFPFDWPWYATVASALIALSVLLLWAREWRQESDGWEEEQA